MATSGSGQLNAWNGSYTITLTFNWTRDGNGVVSWSVNIPTIDGTSSPCWKNFYIRGGSGSSASGDLTGDLVSYCATCSQCMSYGYSGNILWPQTPSGTINMGTSGGTLRLGFFGTRNGGNTEEEYLTWGVDPVSWTASLVYNANGGSNTPATQSQSGLSQSTPDYTFTVTSSEPTRSSHRFDGWADSSSASVPTIFAGDSITVLKSSPSKTIYAVWTRLYTYTLDYNANGGSGAPAAQTYTGEETSHTFTIPNTTPTLAGHSFVGWDFGGQTYMPGDTVTLQSSNPSMTLSAAWVDSYHPGQRKINGTWSSLNRLGGTCQRKVSGLYDDLRTIDGGIGTGDPPSRKTSGTWYNQRKIGAE